MKHVFLAGVGISAIMAGSAFAADMPLKAPAYVPPPVYSWTGWYAGANAGYAWDSDTVNVSTVPIFLNSTLSPSGLSAPAATAVGATGSFPTRTNGFTGGGQIGYNYQVSNFIVAGIEADFQGMGGSASSNVTNVTPRVGFPPLTMVTNVSVTQRLNDLGTVRGRVGALLTPTLLAYGTGGFAYGGAQSSTSITSAEVPNTGSTNTTGTGSISNMRSGWTAGAGAEWAFARNWTAKAEYIYYDLGTATYSASPLTAFINGTNIVNWVEASSSNVRFNGNIVRVGVNYKFW
jgi:outer membrane immunogenic protein